VFNTAVIYSVSLHQRARGRRLAVRVTRSRFLAGGGMSARRRLDVNGNPEASPAGEATRPNS
jgi:hypothetical protein